MKPSSDYCWRLQEDCLFASYQLLTFSAGLQYVIDERRRNCSIAPIVSAGMDVDHPHGDTSWVSMKHGREFMHLDTLSLYYQGKVLVYV